MVIREWRGRAEVGNEAAYAAHFRREVAPSLRGVRGFLGASLSRREVDGVVEFLVLTRWESMEAIRGFAGDDVERAVVAPGAAAALREFDATVRHYEVVDVVD